MNSLSDFVSVSHQTWIVGNTLADLLIASTMLYHVSFFLLLSTGSLEVDLSTSILQLRSVWTRHGHLSRHILVSIVRLTIETNLVTSKDVSWCSTSTLTSRLYSYCQHCSIVNGPPAPREWFYRHAHFSAKTDKSNKVEQVVYVPVCFSFLQIIFMRVVW